MRTKFGSYLKQLRHDRKLTLREVQEQVHVSNAYLSQVESGERGTPTLKILSKLAKVYGVPVSVLNAEAEEQLINSEAGKYNGEEIEVPAPDTEFICRGYEKLSKENKQTLRKFMQHLLKDNKENK